MTAHGAPSPFEAHVRRQPIASQPGTDGSGASRTPLQHLDGIITPSRLHFERHHSGIPDIDPARHKLYVHGLVERPLAFDVESLSRYPMVSRVQFLECSGNSGVLIAPQAQDMDCAAIHGLLSVSEWGGVSLAVLLDEAGLEPAGKWIVADGADAAVMSARITQVDLLNEGIALRSKVFRAGFFPAVDPDHIPVVADLDRFRDARCSLDRMRGLPDCSSCGTECSYRAP